MTRLGNTLAEIRFQAHSADYCASEYFLFLEPALKENAEPLLAFWAKNTGNVLSAERLKRSLTEIAGLDLPLEARKGFPRLLTAFFEYLSATGRLPEADKWSQLISRMEPDYLKSFREDGSVRGETVRKTGHDVGPNEPCPCGSGKKHKKCCSGQFRGGMAGLP